MADIKRVEAIVDALLRRAKGGKARWEQDTSTSFISAGADYSIRVGIESGDQFTHDQFLIEIFNASGEVIESHTPNFVDELRDELSDLYEIARRSALGVDDILDNVLKDLTD